MHLVDLYPLRHLRDRGLLAGLHQLREQAMTDPECLFTQADIENAPDVETEDPEEED